MPFSLLGCHPLWAVYFQKYMKIDFEKTRNKFRPLVDEVAESFSRQTGNFELIFLKLLAKVDCSRHFYDVILYCTI